MHTENFIVDFGKNVGKNAFFLITIGKALRRIHYFFHYL